MENKMIKVELTPNLCLQIHTFLNKLPRDQVNVMMIEFEKQLEDHNKKVAELQKKEEK